MLTVLGGKISQNWSSRARSCFQGSCVVDHRTRQFSVTEEETNPFRTIFPYEKTLFWYPPHQSRAAKQLKNGIHHIDMVVEVRDARIPLTSVNPTFDSLLGRRERLVLYNKADLANPNFVQPIIQGFKNYRNETVYFTSANQDKNVKKVIDFAVDKCKKDPQRFPFLSLVVVGNPNVGKSTLINALRRLGVKRGKVTAVGAKAGVTTSIQTRVKIFADPPIYLVDTPGIYDPHIGGNPIHGLKISLTGGTNDQLTELPNVADYLLFRMNNLKGVRLMYPSVLGIPEPTDDIESLLTTIAVNRGYYIDRGKRGTGRKLIPGVSPPSLDTPTSVPELLMSDNSWRSIPRLSSSTEQQEEDAASKMQEGVEVDLDRAALWMIGLFREGAFGRMTLDNCSPAALEAWFKGQLEGRLSVDNPSGHLKN